MRPVAVLWLCLAGAFANAQEIPLRAGVARVEITPATSMEMYGYSNRQCGPSNGIHDPLFAKALVLEAGGEKLAIVTMDLGNLVSKKLPAQVREQLGIPTLLLAASHTHSGPRFLKYEEENLPGTRYLGELEKKIFDAVKEASGSMFPARLGIGRGSLQLGYNRLTRREDGRSRAMFENPERIPYGPVDPEFVLLRVEDLNGAVKALLVHYACHAVVLGPTNCKYSADYPGVLQARVEAALPGAQCMFVQGGAGDVNPIMMARSGNEEKDFDVVRVMGETLAAQVLSANRTVKPTSSVRYPIQHVDTAMTFANRWEKGKSFDINITTVLINREIAIAAVPGEPMHALQIKWKREADVPYPLFFGYTYSAGGVWPSYIPDIQSAAYGGYGADMSTSIEVGAGEKIMDQHRINLYRMLGLWRDKPGEP